MATTIDSDQLTVNRLPDLWVAIAPREAFSSLRDQSKTVSGWQSMQRPLLVAFVIGCAMTLIASSPLSIWMAISTTIYWSVVPLVEALGLYLVIGKSESGISKPRLFDLYFTGHAPSLIWWMTLAIVWSMLTPIQASSLPFVHARLLVSIGAPVVLWSAYVDYVFFRVIFGRSRGRSCRDLAIQRFVSWGLMIAVFTFGSFWTVVAPQVGR